MLYLYDKAIADDLRKSFNPQNVPNPVVKVVEPDEMVSLAAQIQDDSISFPIVGMIRDPDTPIDTDRTNFTRMHKGIQAVLDPETNNLYYEKAIPIKLSYHIVLLTTNTADTDELMRELMFKYLQQYFITIQLPYECKRKVRFGVTLDIDGAEKDSAHLEYVQSGQLYRTSIPLVCEGCVLVHYTPAKLKRSVHDVEAALQEKLRT